MGRNKAVIRIILAISLIFISGFILYNSHTINIFNPKAECYYDADNLEKYSNYYPLDIKEGFGLNSSQYTLRCMGAEFQRGGFIKAKGEFISGGEFELFYHLGWQAPSGDDSGWIKCFAVEGNDELFNTVKNKICNEVSSEGLNYDKPDSICFTPGLSNYNNDSVVMQKCLEGEYEYSIGNKKVISIIQDADHCSSSVKKGISDCWSIQSQE